MFHINQMLKAKKTLKSSLLELKLPETYVGATVHDFLKESKKGTIQTTSYLKSWGWSLAGNQAGEFLVGKAMVYLLRTEYKKSSDHFGHIKDRGVGPLEEIMLKIHYPNARMQIDEEQGIGFDKWYRVDAICFFYDPTKPIQESELHLVARNMTYPDEPLNEQNALSYMGAMSLG